VQALPAIALFPQVLHHFRERLWIDALLAQGHQNSKGLPVQALEAHVVRLWGPLRARSLADCREQHRSTYCSQDGGHFEHTCVWWRPRTCVSSRTTQAERGQSKSAQVTTATAPGDSSAVDARSSAADASADVGRFEDDIPWARCAALPSRRRGRRQRKGGREGAGKWRGNKGPRFCGTALPAKTSLRCGEGRSARLVLLREGSEAEDSPLQFKASCDRK
jgi:hypothetical protein